MVDVLTAAATPATGFPPAGAPPRQPTLPRMREDLILLAGARAADGGPTWTLHDPAANRFLRIGWLEFEILQRWSLGTVERICQSIRNNTPIDVQPHDVLGFLRFAERAELLFPATESAVKHLTDKVERQRVGPAKWLLKNYLFIRIPLINPDSFLENTKHFASVIFSVQFLWVLGGCALFGLSLIGRRWDEFTHSFQHLFSFEGAVIGGGVLLFAKIMHELGHGYAAKLNNCRVPAMGVAFMVLMPVLWTDTTDAWRLTSRRQRLMIDSGGILAELTLAVLASILWTVQPDGPLRTGFFLLASTTWIITLLINLNPFMRFDGYFLLADWLDIPNLQDRSFALGRWWIREQLFRFNDPPPEVFTPVQQRLLVAYAIAVWVYRFFLFLGIALLVFHLFFKLLGMMLMAVEIGWFIVRPIMIELAVWAQRRRDLRWNSRSIMTLILLSCLIVAAVVPWRTQVSAPAVLLAERLSVLFSTHAGRVIRMPPNVGAAVQEGDAVYILESPDLAYEIRQAERDVRQFQVTALSQAVDPDPDRVSRLPVTWRELEKAMASLQTLEARRDSMIVRAPFAGRIAEMPESLTSGAWVAAKEPLGLVVAPGTEIVEAFVAESEVGRIGIGARAWFLPDDLGPSIAVSIRSIDPVTTTEIRLPELASVYGGPIPARMNGDRRLIPEQALYRVLLAPEEPVKSARALRGTVLIPGNKSSWVERNWKTIFAILVRESGW